MKAFCVCGRVLKGGRSICKQCFDFIMSDTTKPFTEPPKVGHDPVNHPNHYTSHPSGIECIQVTEHLPFCIGNAMKCLWRAGQKGSTIEDLKKAAWYVNREIERLQKMEGAKQ